MKKTTTKKQARVVIKRRSRGRFRACASGRWFPASSPHSPEQLKAAVFTAVCRRFPPRGCSDTRSPMSVANAKHTVLSPVRRHKRSRCSSAGTVSLQEQSSDAGHICARASAAAFIYIVILKT